MAVDVKSLEGNEIADDYVRVAGTEGRLSATWNVFKSSFGKLFLINLLMLVFFAPAVAVLIVRNIIINNSGEWSPFNANTGLGYPANINAAGLAESIFFSADLVFIALLIACGLIASIGIAGGAYSVKKLLNTEGKFSFKGFFHGVKTGYLKTVIPVTVFLVLYYCTVIVGDWKDLTIAQGGSGAGPITAYVFIIIATVLVGLYLAWLAATGVSYRLKFSRLLKNSFSFLIHTPLQTVLLAGVALVPVWLYLIGTAVTFMIFVAYGIFILFGLSYILLVWMSYTQWIFDMYVQPKIKVEETKNKKNAGQTTEEPKDEKDIARELLAAGKSELLGRPILPISEKKAVTLLGQTFTRGDIAKVGVDREKLNGEIAEYENKHKNESVYVEYNKLFAEREKALQPETTKRGKKKKNVSANNLLKR